MAVPGSSTSSFVSSSHTAPTTYAQHTTPSDSAWTPNNSAISPLTSGSSAPQTPLRPLDLGPPGYHATIILYEQTPNETTVYLGPWEVVGTDPPRVVWQCSYQGEVLEHFLPTDLAAVFPYSLHAQHRRFGDPRELELYLSFREPHRIRYATHEGVFHDEYVEVKYEFTTIESSIQFQGDVRRRDLIDWFDVDVIWSDTHGRTDTYGNVRGLSTIQRMKIWRDRYSTSHYISFFANHRRRWKEYLVNDFEPGVRQRDDRHLRLRLQVRGGRRGSAPETSSRDRRISVTSMFRPRQPSNAHTQAGPSTLAAAPVSGLDIRYLGIQFSRNERIQQGTDDYSRFIERWAIAHSSDGEFRVPFPPNHVELESPVMNGHSVNGVESLDGLSELGPAPDGPGSADDDSNT